MQVVDEMEVSGEGLYGDGDVEDLDERADCETSMMSHAETVPMPLRGTASLREEGVVLLEKVLSAQAARDLRAEVLEERERAQQGDFSEILSPIGRAGGQRRFDLQLPLMGSVVSALGIHPLPNITIRTMVTLHDLAISFASLLWQKRRGNFRNLNLAALCDETNSFFLLSSFLSKHAFDVRRQASCLPTMHRWDQCWMRLWAPGGN